MSLTEEDSRQAVIGGLAEYGITDPRAWTDWIVFSKIRDAGCLAVGPQDAARFAMWRVTRQDADAWT